jgi:predicted pyridoxine 5'-phosphate oxidase superfamily flavin-nucleotide-binding protein
MKDGTDSQEHDHSAASPPPRSRTTLGFADCSGNRQYVTLGNLAENEQAFLFLMDYAGRRRIKIWGRARAVEDDPELVSRLMPQGYAARADQAVLFDVEAWDVNCPRHIPQKLDAAEVAEVLATLRNRIEGLEAENRKLCAALGMPSKEPS